MWTMTAEDDFDVDVDDDVDDDDDDFDDDDDNTVVPMNSDWKNNVTKNIERNIFFVEKFILGSYTVE